MPNRPLNPDEAQKLLSAAWQADYDAGPGRDFHYEVTRSSGATVSGMIDKPSDQGIEVLPNRGPSERVQIAWDDISYVSISGD